MSNYSNKKIFSDELYSFLNLKKQPYYLTFVYNAFFEKIKDKKSWNTYKLDDSTKKILNIQWGSYVRASIIKKQIKENHVISTEVPKDIICFKQNNYGIKVVEICI